MREELTEEYEVDKQAALTQLSQQKELEMMAAREGWQRKVEDLLEQVKICWCCSSAQTMGKKRRMIEGGVIVKNRFLFTVMVVVFHAESLSLPLFSP